MEWRFYGPILLAVVMFLLVGTIFEKRIEQALRSFIERRRTQLLQQAQHSSREEVPSNTDTQAKAKTSGTTVLRTTHVPEQETSKAADLKPFITANTTTFNVPAKTSKSADFKMPDVLNPKSTNVPDLKAPYSKTSNVPNYETPNADVKAPVSNLTPKPSIQAPTKTSSLPSVSKIHLPTAANEPNSKSTSKRSLLTCKSAAILGTKNVEFLKTDSHIHKEDEKKNSSSEEKKDKEVRN